MNRFPDHTVARLTNAVVAYRDAAAEMRRLAALPSMRDEVHPLTVPIMQATLEEAARLMEWKASSLEAKIAEMALVEGNA